ncbi:hypothetical protein WSK_2343 [Novosphingobium sp. Rr 2-17]|uniref:DUF2141 domain-containing protein n=1 Tax=Novosphingobium sp. Rr 2-17 TaxID=555793 RepID=UPI000269A1E8|nr:DUF2141 domain-containing protein [Novosphingobium sp. Rr 2-17]EIZ79156.1 hypothetical protein WSK_2343 [Novosphingobium sp. Rr 2-17]
MTKTSSTGSMAVIGRTSTAIALAALVGLSAPSPVLAQYRDEIHNDLGKCTRGEGPALLVTLDGIKSSQGNLRIQTYRATAADWLAKGRWLSRVQVPAKAGRMTFCLPLPGPGVYGVAARHDVNGSGKTDISTDGGGMSNNPSINIFNLGKPSYTKVGVEVGSGVKAIHIDVRYL